VVDLLAWLLVVAVMMVAVVGYGDDCGVVGCVGCVGCSC
jgi:hypothetical protein